MKKFIKSLIPKSVKRGYKAQQKKKAAQQQANLWKGNAVHCPICKASYATFLPFGSPVRENARCHNCKSLERHRLLYLFTEERFQLFSGNTPLRILHFAPERMFYELFSTMSHIDYVPCDLFPELYKYNGNTPITQADITNIPFEDESFDFIICNHVLEHIPDDHKAMKELHRVLKKTGNAIVQVPIDYNLKETYEDWNIVTPEAREKAFGQHDHVRWFGQDYKERLAKAGFTVNEDRFVTEFSSQEAHQLGLNQTEWVYHCKK